MLGGFSFQDARCRGGASMYESDFSLSSWPRSLLVSRCQHCPSFLLRFQCLQLGLMWLLLLFWFHSVFVVFGVVSLLFLCYVRSDYKSFSTGNGVTLRSGQSHLKRPRTESNSLSGIEAHAVTQYVHKTIDYKAKQLLIGHQFNSQPQVLIQTVSSIPS